MEVACWSHARRKLYDIHVSTRSPAALHALELIGDLFAIEADVRGRAPAERRRARVERSGPVLAELKAHLDRKNYLFAGSDEGGRRAAILYTLIGTARLNGLDPQAWLTDVIARIADYPSKRLDDLLPWSWSSTQPPQSEAA